MTRNVRRLARAILGAGLVLALSPGGNAQEKGGAKIDGKLLVGTWQQVKPTGGPQVTIEFTADGKVNSSIDTGDGKSQLFNGTYKLTGNKLVMTFAGEGGQIEGRGTVDKLTRDVFETTDKLGVTLNTKRAPKK